MIAIKEKMPGRPKKIEPDADARLLQRIVTALMDGQGRGGLTWLAGKLGLTPSSLRKRLDSTEGAFDAPTLRASLLVLAMKAERHDGAVLSAETRHGLVIEQRVDYGGNVTTWRPK
jgi:hypothetical protein